jgi:hypothetical protein
METWIFKICKQSAQRQLTTWLLVLAASLALGAYFRHYLADFARGPFNTSAAELRAIRDPDLAPHSFVRVTGELVKDTGVQEETVESENGVETKRYVSASYFALLIDHRFLIVKSPSSPPLTVAGALAPIAPDTASHLFKGLTPQQIEERAYPFELDTQGFRTPGYWALGGAAFFLLLLVRFARPALARFQDPEKHPVMKRIAKWGDRISISSELEREAENPAAQKYGGCILGEKYLIHRSYYTIDVARFEDLLWAYKKILKKRHTFIPVGTDYHAVMIFYGVSKEIQAKEKQVEEMLQFASQRAPWAVIGYNDQIATYYKKQQAAFCAAVEQRRRELKQQPSA